MPLRVSIILLLVIISGCSVTEKNIAGIYKPGKQNNSKLILRENKTFEMILQPRSAVETAGLHSRNIFGLGTWSLSDKDHVELSCASDQPRPAALNDSISRFTNISSFAFWNRYGDPIPIRYITIHGSRPKPHFGNMLYFFSQDFATTDTLRFYFDGYDPVIYPGSIPAAIGNNIHKVTLIEEFSPGKMAGMKLTARRNKLIDQKDGMIFEKKD